MHKLFMPIIAAMLMIGCAEEHKTEIVKGIDGKDGYSTLLQSTSDSELCEGRGGISLVSYLDKDRSETLTNDDLAIPLGSICNGAIGAQGLQGIMGPQGPQGIQGIQGPIGPIGLTGSQGVQGIQGIQGLTGPGGPAGPQGQQGIQGVPGIPGATGPQGIQGTVGATGPQGQPGIQGLTGSGGIYAVQLCPGDNATFPEQGFVVNNQIYAVYYGVTNGSLNSFLARLNPGNYTTTNGYNCQFTVSYPNGVPTINNVPLVDPNVSASSGLACHVYDSRSIDRSNGMNTILTNAVPKFSLVINQLDVGDSQASNGFPKFTAAQQALVGTEDYALDCSGYINVPKTQTYNLTMLSDDGTNTYIDNSLVIAMDQLQSPTAKSASLFLTKGLHKLNVTYFQGPLSQIALKLTWSAPEFTTQVVPNSVLSH